MTLASTWLLCISLEWAWQENTHWLLLLMHSSSADLRAFWLGTFRYGSGKECFHTQLPPPPFLFFLSYNFQIFPQDIGNSSCYVAKKLCLESLQVILDTRSKDFFDAKGTRLFFSLTKSGFNQHFFLGVAGANGNEEMWINALNICLCIWRDLIFQQCY